MSIKTESSSSAIKKITPLTDTAWVKSKSTPSSETLTQTSGDTVDASAKDKIVIDYSTSILDNDLIGSSTGKNVITGGSGADNITGGADADVLNGGDGSDDLIGAAGVDKLNGGKGDDILAGGAGDDILTGGAGYDIFSVDAGTDKILDLGVDGDSVSVSAGATANGFLGANWVAGFETVNDGVANIATKDFGVDLSNASGLHGYSILGAKSGAAVTLKGSLNADTIVGGAGDDAINGAAGNDSLSGGKGADTFTVNVGTDTVTDLGLGGSDVIHVGVGATANATSAKGFTATAATEINGTANISGVKTLDLSLAVGTGSIILTGSDGKDSLSGSATTNTVLIGGKGTDKFFINGSHNTITDFGIEGDDLIVNAGASINVTVSADWTASKVTANNGTASLTTTGFNVDLTKATGANAYTVDAHAAAKGLTLTAGATGATVIGGDFADTLTGGSGVNTLTGGAGADHFVFAKGNVLGHTTITDFTTGTDILNISAKATKGLVAGVVADTAFVVNTTGTADTAAHHFIYNSTDGGLYFDADGSAVKFSPILIETLGVATHPALVATDIVIF